MSAKEAGQTAAMPLDTGRVMPTVPELLDRIRKLLIAVGEDGVCRGEHCDAEIIWVVHANGRRTPYTAEGLNHFIDCPDRDGFRKRRAAAG